MARAAKRSVSDVPIFADTIFKTLHELYNQIGWPYKVNGKELLLKRDQALFSMLVLVGPRASETAIRKQQFLVKETEIILANLETLKGGSIRPPIVLPKTGALSFYTETLEEWLEEVPGKDDYVFPAADTCGSLHWSHPLSRYRIWQIIKKQTGLFPHWFRGVHETIYGKLVLGKDAWKLKEHMGLKRVESTAPYVRGEMEEADKQRLKQL